MAKVHIYRFYVGQGVVRTAGYRSDTITIANLEALDRFGGYTLFEATGGWRDEQGHVVVEETMVWEIITDQPDEARLFAVKLRGWFEQKAVLMVCLGETKTTMV